MLTEQTINEIFSNELSWIGNSEVRSLIIDILKTGPSYFTISASSISKKYHPLDEVVEGGKVLHTRRVFWFTIQLCESQGIIGLERDCLLGAALIHDLWFRGPDDYTNNQTVQGHEKLVRTMTKEFNNRKHYNEIISAAECHSGRWCQDKNTVPENMNHQRLIHTADYLASRRAIFTPTIKKQGGI